MLFCLLCAYNPQQIITRKLPRQLNIPWTNTYIHFLVRVHQDSISIGEEFEKRRSWVMVSRNIPNWSEKASCMGWDFQNWWLRFRFLSHVWTKYSSRSSSICNIWNTDYLTLQSFIISISKRTSKNVVLWIALSSQKSVAKSQLLRLRGRQNLWSALCAGFHELLSHTWSHSKLENAAMLVASKGHQLTYNHIWSVYFLKWPRDDK